jgi:hypothetical protein
VTSAIHHDAAQHPAEQALRADDARVRQEPYYVHCLDMHGPDDIIWASYTDARGELTTEHIPAETSRDQVMPANREAEY